MFFDTEIVDFRHMGTTKEKKARYLWKNLIVVVLIATLLPA